MVDLLLGRSYESLEELATQAVARSPISDATDVLADVVVCPAGGSGDDYEYLPRLNRAYSPYATDDGPVWFEHRVVAALDAVRAAVSPDVTLIDNRSGLHDLSAVAVTQYCELALLFALDKPQTWAGYRSLFNWWAAYPNVAREVRERLKVVAALVPPRGADAYLESFIEHAYDTFRIIYDDLASDGSVAAGIDNDGYHPITPSLDTPHHPILIPHLDLLTDFDPLSNDEWIADAVVDAVVGDLTESVLQLLEPDVSG